MSDPRHISGRSGVAATAATTRPLDASTKTRVSDQQRCNPKKGGRVAAPGRNGHRPPTLTSTNTKVNLTKTVLRPPKVAATTQNRRSEGVAAWLP